METAASVEKAVNTVETFLVEMFKTDAPPVGEEIIAEANKNENTGSSKKVIKKVAGILDVANKIKDAGEVYVNYVETDFKDPVQKGDFIELVVQKSIEQTPIIGDAAEIIMGDAKEADGLTNLSNKRLANDYKGSYNARNATLEALKAARNSGDLQTKSDVANKKKGGG